MTLKSQTELVQVPVIVTDRSKAHVTGLKQEDFHVLENGTERPIATFQEVRNDASLWNRRAGAGEFSNIASDGTSQGRITLIVLDFINTAFEDQVYANHELLKYLMRSTDQHEPTALFTLTRSGLQVIHDFTMDPRILSAALHKVAGENSRIVDPAHAAEIEAGTLTTANGEPLDIGAVKTEATKLQQLQNTSEMALQSYQQAIAITDTLQALQELAQAFRGLPVRKSLIWITGGFPFGINPDSVLPGPGQYALADVTDDYEFTWRMLNDAQISLYPVDAKGLQGIGIASAANGGPGTGLNQPTSSSNAYANMVSNDIVNKQDLLITFETFASMTGGRAYVNRNDLDAGIHEAANDSSQYYMLGYYLDRSIAKPGWNRLAVKVNGQHLTVRARNGFFIPEKPVDPKTIRDNDVALALHSPLEYTAISLVARWAEVQPGKMAGKKHVMYDVHLEPDPIILGGADNNHMVLEFIAQARTPKGEPVGDIIVRKIDGRPTLERMKLFRKKGLDAIGGIDLAPGEYTVRFVVSDDLSGRLGSVDAPLKVE